MHYETRSISLNAPMTAIHPATGKPCNVVGVTGEDTDSPKLVILVTGPDGTRCETVAWVRNDARRH